MKWTIRALRVNKGLRQTDLALALNVDRKTIGAWESGSAMPRWDKIDAICGFFGVTYDDIQWKV